MPLPIFDRRSSPYSPKAGIGCFGVHGYAKNEDAKLFATLTKWQGPSGAGSRGNGTGANIGLEAETKKVHKLPTGLGLR